LSERVNRPFRIAGAYILLAIRLTPKGGRDALDGIKVLADGQCVLCARVRAAPEDGAANDALLKLLSKALDVPASRLSLVSGQTSRLKTVQIPACEGVLTRLDALCGARD